MVGDSKVEMLLICNFVGFGLWGGRAENTTIRKGIAALLLPGGFSDSSVLVGF